MDSDNDRGSDSSTSGGEIVRNEHDAGHLARLSLTALGVVFGDIATSPLYAVRECFHGEYAITVSHENVLGVLSLMFWTLLMIVSIKYLSFVLRADNHGEGGVIALTALLRRKGNETRWGRGLLTAGLFAACLLYGDGMITPAISVLSAVEGIRIVMPGFGHYVVPLTIMILATLFCLQQRGTARVGRLFGPIILLWLGTLAVLGVIQVTINPGVFVSLFPWHGIDFLIRNKTAGFMVLGAVFLTVTGTEALYADLGHFGARPIRLTWGVLVMPALVLNYFGQGALLLEHPEAAHHPFYGLVPSWALGPTVLLATLSTIIASQAVITGAFSLSRQAIQLGYLPRMQICHTSAAHIGQIYMPQVNWLLMFCTIGLVLGFQSSSNLAAAYGVAVTSTMLITTVLFCQVAQKRWGWSLMRSSLLAGLFLAVDIPFFCANASKIFHGAWFPLLIGALFFFLMQTWKRGRENLSRELAKLTPTLSDLHKILEKYSPKRITGQAIFLTGSTDRVPAAFIHNLRHNKVLHSEIVFLHFKTADMPRVNNFEKIESRKLGGGFYCVIATYGFMETPNISNALALAHEAGLEIKSENASLFLGRERLTLGEHPKMVRRRAALFLFMSRNATDVATFYDIPSDQIIEIGVQLEL